MADIWNDLTDAIGKDMAISEMSKKYGNTFLTLVREDGSQTVVQYLGYETEAHWFTDVLGTKIKLRHDTNQKLVCNFPERLLFNHKGVALEFIRKTTRQYRRGICKDNVQIYSPVRKMFSGDSYPWTIHTLVDALNPQYPTSCEEAIKTLDSRSVVSIALSSKFMLTHSFTNEDEYYLFYCNVVIGNFNNGKFHIKHSLFSQEVLDNIELFSPFKVEF